MTPDLESAAPLPQSISGGSCFKISCNQYKLGVYPVYPWYVAPGGFNVSERSLDVADKHPRVSEAGMEPKICLQYFTIVYTTREYHWLQSSHYRSETKLPHNRLGWP